MIKEKPVRPSVQTLKYGIFTPNCHRDRADLFKATAHRLLAEGDDEGHDAFLRTADHHEMMAVSATQLAA